MIPITFLKGDATCPQTKGSKIIAHICNDMNKWGKGFVLAVSKKWPLAKDSYHFWAKTDGLKLGAVQFVQVEPHIIIANMVSQKGIGTGSNGPPIRYDSFCSCLKEIARKAKETSSSVHMPQGIGSGLAGGKFEKIKEVVEAELCQHNISVFMYDFGS